MLASTDRSVSSRRSLRVIALATRMAALKIIAPTKSAISGRQYFSIKCRRATRRTVACRQPVSHPTIADNGRIKPRVVRCRYGKLLYAGESVECPALPLISRLTHGKCGSTLRAALQPKVDAHAGRTKSKAPAEAGALRFGPTVGGHCYFNGLGSSLPNL